MLVTMDAKQGNLHDYLTTHDKEQLDDWTFNGVDTKYMTHGLHPYPARMIPQIARRLVTIYARGKEPVWDPFCGSGSTLVEAMIMGRNSIGTDLNPFATFLSKVKTTPLDIAKLRKVSDNVLKATRERLQKATKDAEIPVMHNPTYYFKEDVILDLAEIKDEVFAVSDGDIRDFLRLCLASTARDVSNLKKNEFKIVHMGQAKVEDFKPDVQVTFGNHVERCIRLMESFVRKLEGENPSAEIYTIDNRELALEENSIDVVVTSPPYGDHSTTVAYGQFSRYPGIWAGIEEDKLKSVDRIGLGGRSHSNYSSEILNSTLLDTTYQKILKNSEKRAKQFFNFFLDLNGSLLAMYHALKNGSHACIVVGNRLMSRIRIPTDAIIVELGQNIGFAHITTIGRDIPTKRMPWQNAPENVEGYSADTMHNEHIIILQKR